MSFSLHWVIRTEFSSVRVHSEICLLNIMLQSRISLYERSEALIICLRTLKQKIFHRDCGDNREQKHWTSLKRNKACVCSIEKSVYSNLKKKLWFNWFFKSQYQIATTFKVWKFNQGLSEMEKASNTENFDSARVNKQCCDIQDFPALTPGTCQSWMIYDTSIRFDWWKRRQYFRAAFL